MKNCCLILFLFSLAQVFAQNNKKIKTITVWKTEHGESNFMWVDGNHKFYYDTAGQMTKSVNLVEYDTTYYFYQNSRLHQEITGLQSGKKDTITYLYSGDTVYYRVGWRNEVIEVYDKLARIIYRKIDYQEETYRYTPTGYIKKYRDVMGGEHVEYYDTNEVLIRVEYREMNEDDYSLFEKAQIKEWTYKDILDENGNWTLRVKYTKGEPVIDYHRIIEYY